MPIARKIVLAGLVSLTLAIGLMVAAPALAAYAVAPDVVVFCEPTLRPAVNDAASLWRARTDVPVRVFASPTWALLQQIAHHARDDVVIGEGDGEAQDATARDLVKPQTLQRLWRNRLVVAALKSATANPGPGSPSTMGGLAALAGKVPIAVVDPWAAAAGSDSEKSLQALGLWQAVSTNSIGAPDTADAGYLLTNGKVRLAIVYATDVAADARLTIGERLPAASYPPIVYWTAETQHALSPNTARFIAFLQDPAVRRRLPADGLELSP